MGKTAFSTLNSPDAFTQFNRWEGVIMVVLTRKERNCSAWCGSVNWAPACEPEGCRVESQSGHMPGLHARSPVGGTQEATTYWCFSPSFSLPSSYFKNKYFRRKKYIYRYRYLSTYLSIYIFTWGIFMWQCTTKGQRKILPKFNTFSWILLSASGSQTLVCASKLSGRLINLQISGSSPQSIGFSRSSISVSSQVVLMLLVSVNDTWGAADPGVWWALRHTWPTVCHWDHITPEMAENLTVAWFVGVYFSLINSGGMSGDQGSCSY